MGDLLPCPWCGETKIEPVDATRILGMWNIIHRCPVIGPFKIELSTREAVISIWNTRAALPSATQAGGWMPINSAPKDRDLLVWFDHEADPYQDPEDLNRLTDYAAWAEGGVFLDGQGWCIARWLPEHWEAVDEYGGGYWLPAWWFAHENGDYERVVNPIYWKPLEAPLPPAPEASAQREEARKG